MMKSKDDIFRNGEGYPDPTAGRAIKKTLKDHRRRKPLKVRIHYHTDAGRIRQAHEGEWFDVRAAEDRDLAAGEFAYISLGISVELPKGYEAHIRPRSSTFRRWGLRMECSGVIDNAYRGDADVWAFGALASRDTHISKGDFICQFRLVREQPNIDFIETDYLTGKPRGGFGSTGRR